MECNNATPTLDLKVSNHYHASIQRNEKRKSKENCATCTTVTGEETKPKGKKRGFLGLLPTKFPAGLSSFANIHVEDEIQTA